MAPAHRRPVAAPLKEGLEPEAGARHRAGRPGGAAVTAVCRGEAAAGAVVAWVLVFGSVTGLGELVVRYGGANLLGDHTIPHYFAAHRTAALGGDSLFWSDAGDIHAIRGVGLIAGALALAFIRRWRGLPGGTDGPASC